MSTNFTLAGIVNFWGNVVILKFIYSEKATKFCKISTLLLSVCTVDKSKVEILKKIWAFSEYTNFTPQANFPAHTLN